MRKISLIFFLLSNFSFSQNIELPFIDGESCTYRISYGIFGGGEAKYVLNKNHKETKVVVSGSSNSFVDIFFMVRNRYETIVNNSTLLPRYFKRDNIEGGYKIKQEYNFNYNSNTIFTQKGIFDLVPNSFDMISAFIYGRALTTSYLKENSILYINLFLDEENYNMQVNFLGTEIIPTSIGKIQCLKFSPKVQTGRVFKNEDDLTIWVSDDKNHLLIKVEMGILVGSIEANITSVENIKFPLSITE